MKNHTTGNPSIGKIIAQRGGYTGFQVSGFFGFEIFDSGIFLGKIIWHVFFRVA